MNDEQEQITVGILIRMLEKLDPNKPVFISPENGVNLRAYVVSSGKVFMGNASKYELVDAVSVQA